MKVDGIRNLVVTSKAGPSGAADSSRSVVYHRLKNATTLTPQVANLQQASGQIWGGPPNAPTASVKAYRGPLPTNKRGVEFVAEVAPTPGEALTSADCYVPLFSPASTR